MSQRPVMNSRTVCRAGLLGWIVISVLSAAPLPNSNLNKYESKNDQRNYFLQFGYMENKGISRNRNLVDDDAAFRQAVKKLQSFAGLNQTGEMNKETMELMNRRRCHLPDVGVDPRYFSKRAKRYVLISRYISTFLTWNVDQYPSGPTYLRPNDIDRIISTSFADWAAYAPLYFQRSSYGPRVNIAFLGGDHNDGFPFDGPGNILAHAFFPEDGRLHFDSAESWTDGRDSGTNLRSVATHEIGHILGLGHSAVPNTVMSPYYTDYNPTFSLAQDDIDAIQFLYGKRNYQETTFKLLTTPSTVTSTTTTRTTTTTTTTTTTATTTIAISTPAPYQTPDPQAARTTSQNSPKPWIPVYTTPSIYYYYTTPAFRFFTTPYYQRYTTPPPFWNNGKK